MLLSESSPADAIRQLAAAVAAHEAEAAALSSSACRLQTSLDALRRVAESALARLTPVAVARQSEPEPGWLAHVCRHVEDRAGAAAGDCPLPELFALARGVEPDLSVGRFHDGLRRLHAAARIGLQPWTGPLSELPEPDLAFLVGHQVAYYASRPLPAPGPK